MNIKRLLTCVFVILFVWGSSGMPANAAPPREGEGPIATGDELWDDQFLLGVNYSPAPINTWVFAVAVSGTDVYVGGDLDAAGDVAASRIAKWDSAANKWSALGSGVNSRVNAIAARGDDVYVGGNFNRAGGQSIGYIAHWDEATQSWSALGSGLTHTSTSPEVEAIAIAANGDVYVGGEFETAGGLPANNIARWDGGAWHALSTGVGGGNHTVAAIAVSGSDVYVGGEFTTAGGSPASHVAKWNGSIWSPLGGGANNDVDAIAVAGTSVYIAGTFSSVHDTIDRTAGHVAMWNGSVWNTLDGGVGFPDAYALAVGPDSKVYLGGRFTTLADGTTSAQYLAKWNGSHWTAVGGSVALTPNDGVDGYVYAMAFMGDQLFMGGHMADANEGRSMNHIGYWDISDGEWYGLGNSVNGMVWDIAIKGDIVYLGGTFTSAGGVKASRLARWNRRTGEWSAIGEGVGGCTGSSLIACSPVVYSLELYGDYLYVGGNFTSVGGGIPAQGFVRVDTRYDSWYIPSGVSCEGVDCGAFVRTMSIEGGDVYIGGLFDYVGLNTVANNVAMWYAEGGWHTFGSGTSSTVYSIFARGPNEVFIGGSFSTPAQRAALWRNNQWNDLNGNLNGVVYVITPQTSANTYFGGAFTDAGGNAAADHIVVLGLGWGALGAGLDGTVYSLCKTYNDLYAGGAFTISGIVGMNHIGRFYSGGWYALGSGTDKTVYALAFDNGKVYAGGSFTSAGGKPSWFFGRFGPELVYLPVAVR